VKALNGIFFGNSIYLLANHVYQHIEIYLEKDCP